MTPSDIEKSRKEFEQLCVKSQLCSKDYIFKINSTPGKPRLDEYQNSQIEDRFQGFLMARESLVVELPESHQHYYPDESAVEDETFLASDIENMLKSAGINYRERE